MPLVISINEIGRRGGGGGGPGSVVTRAELVLPPHVGDLTAAADATGVR
jgi:hypothetical protein